MGNPDFSKIKRDFKNRVQFVVTLDPNNHYRVKVSGDNKKKIEIQEFPDDCPHMGKGSRTSFRDNECKVICVAPIDSVIRFINQESEYIGERVIKDLISNKISCGDDFFCNVKELK